MLAITKQLEEQGVSRHVSAPLLYRIAWRMGLHWKPPLYQSFRRRALSYGIPFSIIFIVFLRLAPPYGGDLSTIDRVAVGAFTGIMMGLAMAWMVDDGNRKLKLPPLEDPSTPRIEGAETPRD